MSGFQEMLVSAKPPINFVNSRVCVHTHVRVSTDTVWRSALCVGTAFTFSAFSGALGRVLCRAATQQLDLRVHLARRVRFGRRGGQERPEQANGGAARIWKLEEEVAVVVAVPEETVPGDEEQEGERAHCRDAKPRSQTG